jgi:predicted lipase
MKKDIKRMLLQLRHDCDNYRYRPKVYLTGHSEGGCLASLYTLELRRDIQLPHPVNVCTFGAPQVGDQAFAEHYNQSIRQTTPENHLDIVPFLSSGSNGPMASILKDPCRKNDMGKQVNM